MNAMEDSMLSYSFLKLCLGAYIPSGYDANNFYLSPLNAPDDVYILILQELVPELIIYIIGTCKASTDQADDWRERSSGR